MGATPVTTGGHLHCRLHTGLVARGCLLLCFVEGWRGKHCLWDHAVNIRHGSVYSHKILP